ncbi:MAG TPA: DUF5906 domain-containing protein [Nevskiaceae bacterium]|nr:DUF5906 domain-containing protein [Nevskiaceae bacterium]
MTEPLAKSPERNLADARVFLGALDAAGASFTFQTFDDSPSKRKSLGQIVHGTLDERWRWLSRMNDQGAGVFVTVNATDGEGREARNITRVRALFVDLDGAPLDPVMQAPLLPQIVVESSPGRWHAYWLVRDCPRKDFRQYQRGLIARFQADKSVHDLPRVMRVPGFIHRKHEPFVSRLHALHELPPYDIAALVLAFELEKPLAPELPAASAAKAAPAPLPQSTADDVADDLRDALRSIGSDDYGTWISIGMALATLGNAGMPLWLEWSSKSAKYDPQAALDKWKSFKPEQTDHKVVFAEAKKHGWDPRRAPSVQRKRAARAPARPERVPAPGDPADAAAPAPAPPQNSPEALLQRYELIYGTKNVWDCELGSEMSFSAFTALVGKAAASGWLENDKRRVRMLPGAPKKTGKKDKREPPPFSTKVEWMLPRYALIYSEEAVFDREKRIEMTLGALRAFAGLKAVRDWGDHPKREVVNKEQVIFDPKRDVDDPSICNLWGGWPRIPKKGTPADEALVDRWMKVVHYCCGESDAITDWVLRWIAYPLRYPGTKMRTSIIMHGPEGSGKNTIWDAVRRIFGRYGIQITQTQLEQQWCDWISAKLFIVGNEVLHRQEQVQQKGRLKTMISDDTLRVERKFMNGRDEINFANLVFLSNELQPLSIDPGDRRFLVIWTPPPHPDGYDYYRGLGADAMPESAVDALYHRLLQLDLEDFGPHTKPPMTAAKQDLIDASMESNQRFLRDWIAGALPVPYGPCKTQQLFHAYLYWCRENGERFPKPENKFAARAKKDVPAAVKWYLVGQSKKQGTFYLPRGINPPPQNEKSEAAWLSDGMERFRREFEEWKNEHGS